MHNFIPHVGSSTMKPSNQSLLRVAAFTFLFFVIAEVVGAVRSHSLSLLGDAIAMSVDVFTYFANMYAEATKHDINSKNFNSRFVNECCIPSISVTCLLGVTVYITIDAVKVLENPPARDDVPLSYLYGFSIVNLMIDLTCATFFYIRGKDVFYEPIIPLPLISLEVSLDAEEEEKEFGHLDEDLDFNFSGNNSNSFYNSQRYREGSNGIGEMKKNLNMLSAFTHVGGDTVRTISVLGAAGISSAFGIEAAVCDAWAAVAVSITIVAISLPLIIDIILAAQNIVNENSGGGGGGGLYAPVPPFQRGKDPESTLGVGVFF